MNIRNVDKKKAFNLKLHHPDIATLNIFPNASFSYECIYRNRQNCKSGVIINIVIKFFTN